MWSCRISVPTLNTGSNPVQEHKNVIMSALQGDIHKIIVSTHIEITLYSTQMISLNLRRPRDLENTQSNVVIEGEVVGGSGHLAAACRRPCRG